MLDETDITRGTARDIARLGLQRQTVSNSQLWRTMSAHRCRLRECLDAMKWRILAGLLLSGLVLRGATFGDPALHIDEEFYFVVGQRMLEGALPYVDIWDRKPPGLFLIYAAIAAVSRDVLAYQLAAWLAASMTAFTISRIVAGWTGWRGQFFSGLTYLACITATGGFGGQSPVFYNLLMANAALLIVQSFSALEDGKVPLKVYGAIALCGFALTIKQVTIAESIFFGMFSIFVATRSGYINPRRTLLIFAALGAAPFLIFFLVYMHHWQAFWQAMVISNLSKAQLSFGEMAQRAGAMIYSNIVAIVIATVGGFLMKASIERKFVCGWLISSLVGVVLVPNFYWHYALPLFVPLAVLGAKVFDRSQSGPICAVVLVVLCVYKGDAFNFALHRQARISMEKLAASVTRHNPRNTMLVYDGPVYLFAMTEAKALSPVILPWHLTETSERYSNGQDMREELLRILAQHPGVIVLAKERRAASQDQVGRRIVERYVAANCRLVDQQITRESRRRDIIQVWGECR